MSFKKIDNLIKKYETIVFVKHERPDGDALGSSFGLAELIKDNYADKKIKIVGSSAFGNLAKLFPKCLKEPKYNKEILIIANDTPNLSRIDSKQDINLAGGLIKIDHHPVVDIFGDVQLGSVDYSSNCEIIVDLAISLKWKISKKAANFLYIGMVTDTNRFMHSTKEETLTRASVLMGAGATWKEIYRTLYARDLKQMKYSSHIISNMKQEEEHKVIHFISPKNLHEKFDLSYEYASSSVNTLLNFKGYDFALFSTFDENNNVWKVSLRSLTKPVSPICEKFGGGGHKQACGIKVKSKKEILEILDELKKIGKGK